MASWRTASWVRYNVGSRREYTADVFSGCSALLPRSPTMLSQECLLELRSSWLPNMSDAGLDRLIDLLEKGSPLLIHGCFTKSVPMGCLATHVAWNHPRTAHLTIDAGINWLHRVAKLNPATSYVIREWDSRGSQNWE